jgi:hypothetical protein
LKRRGRVHAGRPLWDNRRLTFPVYLGVGAWQIHPHWVFDASPIHRIPAYCACAAGAGRARRGHALVDHRGGDRGRGDRQQVALLARGSGPRRSPTGGSRSSLGGKTVVGALVGGLIAVEIAKRWLGITRELAISSRCRSRSASASAASAVPVGPARSPHRYHPRCRGRWTSATASPPSHGLYETTFLWLFAAFLARILARPHREGDVFRLFMVGYLAFRLVVDAIKPEVRVALGLSAIQWTALAVIVHYRHDVARWLTK